jgi:hypothetical protein
MERHLDCYCDTCRCNITLQEIKDNFHANHEFSPVDRLTLELTQKKLRSTEGNSLGPDVRTFAASAGAQ